MRKTLDLEEYSGGMLLGGMLGENLIDLALSKKSLVAYLDKNFQPEMILITAFQPEMILITADRAL